MKPFPLKGAFAFAACLAMVALLPVWHRATAFEPHPPMLPLSINILVEVFELPREKFNELSAQQKPGVRADDLLLQRVRSLVEEGPAKLTEHHSVNTRSGQRASVENNNEVIYGTEFSDETGRPTAFTMRPCGFRSEVDPVIGPDGFTVDLTLSVEVCEFFGMEKQHYTNPKTKKSFSVEQPRFYSRRLQTSITTYDGMPRLMGNFGAKGDPQGKSGIVGVVFVTPTLVN